MANAIQPGLVRPPITSRDVRHEGIPERHQHCRTAVSLISWASADTRSPTFRRIPLVRAWGCRYRPIPTHPLVDMSQGVPDIHPPRLLLDAIAAHGSSESTCSYTIVSGEPSMRSSLALEMRLVYGNRTDVTPDDIVLTAGCNMAFVATVMALADPGDQIILPVPW